MPITLGGSSRASGFAAFQLGVHQKLLEKSLARISSGKRILSSSDDPGNLAVSMKLQSAINMTSAVGTNVSNALSYSEMQDSSLENAGDILTEMSTLRAAYDGLSTSDQANYDTEFQGLRAELHDLMSGQFNDVSLFSFTESGGMTVYTNPTSSSGIGIEMGKLNLQDALGTGAAGASSFSDSSTAQAAGEALFGSSNSGSAGLGDFSAANIEEAISNVASLRAESGSVSSRLTFSQDRLSSNKVGLETAYSRIMDVDLASEIVNYAKSSVQVYAAAAMLAQANLNMSIVTDLLMASMRK